MKTALLMSPGGDYSFPLTAWNEAVLLAGGDLLMMGGGKPGIGWYLARLEEVEKVERTMPTMDIVMDESEAWATIKTTA